MSNITLKQKAEQILQEKAEKIIPENFSKELTIFGVNGSIKQIKDIGSLSVRYNKLENMYNKVRCWGNINLGPNTPLLVNQDDALNIDISYQDIARTLSITADKIAVGSLVCGVQGTYVGVGDTPDIPPFQDFLLAYKSEYLDLPEFIDISGAQGRGVSITNSVFYDSLEPYLAEMPYLFLNVNISSRPELQNGFECWYNIFGYTAPAIPKPNEENYSDRFDIVLPYTFIPNKQCFILQSNSEIFTNIEYDPETGEEYVTTEYNSEEFWEALVNVIENTAFVFNRQQIVEDYSITELLQSNSLIYTNYID